LDGKTFVEALQACVIDDPQVAVLNKLVILARGEPAPFGNDWKSHHAVWSAEHGRNCASGGGVTGAVGFLRKFENPTQYNREAVANAAVGRRFARLIDFLAAGQLVAEGVPMGGGSAVTIPRSIWRRERTYIDLLNGDLLELDPRSEDHTTALTGPTFTGLMLSKPRTPAETLSADVADSGLAAILKPCRSTERVVTKANAETACVTWLSRMMRSSPTKRLQTKGEVWPQAQAKWPGKLAFRGFDRAWGRAARVAKAPAWSAGGRPPKSPQA